MNKEICYLLLIICFIILVYASFKNSQKKERRDLLFAELILENTRLRQKILVNIQGLTDIEAIKYIREHYYIDILGAKKIIDELNKK